MLCASGMPARAQLLPWPEAGGLGPNMRLHAAGTLSDSAVLEVDGTEAKSVTTVLTVNDPAVPSHEYQLRGQIKYEKVQGTAFLEMWSFFPDSGRYFTQTLADNGPMGTITGSSGWREVILPFYSKPGMLPNKLTVSLVLPGAGKVFLTQLELTAITSDAISTGWWSDPQGGLIGGIGGALYGICGGLIGTLCTLGRGRRLALAVCWACVIGGALSLVIGVVALCLGQPYHVWYPPLLGGIIGTAVCGGLLPVIRRRFNEHEMRRMAALDAS
jgi:hypothetical protein